MKAALLTAAVLSAALCAATPAALASPGGCPANPVIAYQPPTPPIEDNGPFGITQGPGGTWYADSATINRINTDGIEQFTIPGEAAVGWLTWDGGSDVWFAGRSSGRIGTINGKGAVHEYQIPDGVNGPAVPQAIVLGPGPQVWFTDETNDRIGDLDTTTGAMTFYAVPSGDPLGLVRGSDGALYFTERGYDKIGRMAPDGTFTEWSLAPGSFPNRITVGPDGAIWFTELLTGQIGRIAPEGTLTETPVDGGPVGITTGPDGHLYVALWDASEVARVNTAGAVTRTWPVPGALQVAVSRDSVWATDPYSDSVSRVRTHC